MDGIMDCTNAMMFQPNFDTFPQALPVSPSMGHEKYQLPTPPDSPNHLIDISDATMTIEAIQVMTAELSATSEPLCFSHGLFCDDVSAEDLMRTYPENIVDLPEIFSSPFHVPTILAPEDQHTEMNEYNVPSPSPSPNYSEPSFFHLEPSFLQSQGDYTRFGRTHSSSIGDESDLDSSISEESLVINGSTTTPYHAISPYLQSQTYIQYEQSRTHPYICRTDNISISDIKSGKSTGKVTKHKSRRSNKRSVSSENNRDSEERIKSVSKGARGRGRREAMRGNHLWEFIRDLLKNDAYCPKYIRWEDRTEGVFRFVNSEMVATMWGQKKNNPQMTYEKLSRAMRYYYKREILERVDGRRLVYKFGRNADGWKEAAAPAEIKEEN